MPGVASTSAIGGADQVEPGGDPPQPRRGLSRQWVAAVAVLCALAGLAIWRATDDGPTPLTRSDVDRAVEKGVERAREQDRNAPSDAATAFRTIQPSLVAVTADGATSDGSLGTGVVINAEGAVLTALHVVDGGGGITVRFADGTQGSARIARRDADSDIAVLTVDRLPELVVPAVMGGPPPVGEPVFAVGNPLGLLGSLSAGVVSAGDRSVSAEGGRTLKDLIQFDAAVNPGNSGGPLLNRGGQVVGIVTGLANPSRQSFFVGIGFAVPIATAGGVAGGPQQ
jgi:S1-C subfamily serine protease